MMTIISMTFSFISSVFIVPNLKDDKFQKTLKLIIIITACLSFFIVYPFSLYHDFLTYYMDSYPLIFLIAVILSYILLQLLFNILKKFIITKKQEFYCINGNKHIYTLIKDGNKFKRILNSKSYKEEHNKVKIIQFDYIDPSKEKQNFKLYQKMITINKIQTCKNKHFKNCLKFILKCDKTMHSLTGAFYSTLFAFLLSCLPIIKIFIKNQLLCFTNLFEFICTTVSFISLISAIILIKKYLYK